MTTYVKRYYEKYRKNKCKCGNIKLKNSRRCRECFIKYNRRQLSRVLDVPLPMPRGYVL